MLFDNKKNETCMVNVHKIALNRDDDKRYKMLCKA